MSDSNKNDFPQMCDCFVIISPQQGPVIFAKNAHRPRGDVQEVLYIPANKIAPKTTKCTFIQVDGVDQTNKAVILSKSSGTWGAEMGSNECNVTIGNVGVFNKLIDEESDPKIKRLLGVDLVRLALERSSSANEALDVIIKLLEQYGQGGPCSTENPDLFYHNSFLIADPSHAWVLETCGKHWAAEEITEGCRNITGILSIGTNIHKKSNGLEEYAISNNLWDGNGDFNFSEVFSLPNTSANLQREQRKALIEQVINEDKKIELDDIFGILRNTESQMCKPCENNELFCTTGSQASVISSTRPSVHWFTATPDPTISIFKPFIFTKNAKISRHTICLDEKTPHTLYALHAKAKKKGTWEVLRSMELECIKEVEEKVSNIGEDLGEFDELLKDCVEAEVKFYR